MSYYNFDDHFRTPHKVCQQESKIVAPEKEFSFSKKLPSYLRKLRKRKIKKSKPDNVVNLPIKILKSNYMLITHKISAISLPKYIQILWNNINVGCFYLDKAAGRQQYFQLLAQAQNPPDIIDFAAVFFDEQLVLEVDREQKVSLNLLRDFYQDNPCYLQQIKPQFVCYPPQFILDWESNFCHCNSQTRREPLVFNLFPVREVCQTRKA